MRHFTSPDFWKAFNNLPLDAQASARQAFEILNSNPRHPSLRFKRIGEFWSVRVGLGYRALGKDVDGGIL